MDWMPASRSRSRHADSSKGYDQHGMGHPNSGFDGRFTFPSLESDRPETSKVTTSTSPSIPIPGAMSMLTAKRPSPPYNASRSELTSVYEENNSDALGGSSGYNPDGSIDSRYLESLNYPHHPHGHHHHHHSHPLSTYNSPTFAPSSLPSYGLHGVARMPSNSSSDNHRSFPRHVRKTSFDHTVSKDGVFPGLSGRHQVNGKPLSPDSLIGTKRRADAPHAESMLRADPSNVDGIAPMPIVGPSRSQAQANQDSGADQYEHGSPFPSSSFNFSFPPYEGLFDLPAGAGEYSGEGSYHRDSARSSISAAGNSYRPGVSPPNNANGEGGLSAAAAAASAALAEGYAQLSAANLAAGGVDDPSSPIDYRHLMGLGLVYGGDGGGGGLGQTYTHVDPTQILSSVPGGEGSAGYVSFHASPSSDGWGPVGGSAHASPEPYNASNASTPPSVDGNPVNIQGGSGPTAQNGRAGRKYISLKGDMRPRKSLPGSPTLGTLRSSTSTPDLGHSKGGSEDSGETPTLCTNCQTTNTPLWRRDPEGQPLCMCLFYARDHPIELTPFTSCR